MALSREQFDALRAKGLSVEQIVRFESGERGQTLAPTGQPPAPPRPRPTLGPAPIASHPLAWLAQGGQDVPGLMAAPGGFLPGPVGRGAAAAGGAGGSIIEQLAQGRPLNLGQAVRESGKQAALTAGGQLLGGTSRAIGTGAMRMALRPGVNTIRRSPGVVKDALEQGATVRRFAGTGGEEAAVKELGRRGAVTTAGVKRVDAQGIPLAGGVVAKVKLKMSRMIPALDDVVGKKSSKGIAQRKEAQAVIDEMLENYKKPQSMEEVKAIKQQLQDEARAVWEAIPNPSKKLRFNDKGIPIGEDVPIEVRIKFATANRLQKFMEGIPEGATGIPGGFKASEGATARAIGVRNAIRDATLRAEGGLPTWMPQGIGRGALTLGGGLAGASMGDSPQEKGAFGALGTLAGGALADPGVTSRLAQLLYQQYALPALLRQSPRAAEMLFNSGTLPDSLSDER